MQAIIGGPDPKFKLHTSTAHQIWLCSCCGFKGLLNAWQQPGRTRGRKMEQILMEPLLKRTHFIFLKSSATERLELSYNIPR